MRRASILVLGATLALLAACNALTGTDKYVVEDCVGEQCRDAAAVDGGKPATADDGGSDGSTVGTTCPATTSPVIAKCSEGELGRSIHTAPDDLRVIAVPNGDKEAPLDPNCMMIRAGQSVTWRGNLGFHPIIQREDSTLPNPIPTLASGTEATVAFPCPGDYNFSCRNHRDSMLGTIRVLP